MSQQPMFFEKNKIDLNESNISITVSDAVATNDGASFLDLMRNRNNTSGWITTDSTDAANTTITVDMVDTQDIDQILLLNHNLKAYTIKYWDGAAYQDFSTAISETTNTAVNSSYSFTQVSTSRVQIIITGAQTVDADKFIAQLILTAKINTTGQLIGWPIFKKTQLDLSKRSVEAISGKLHVSDKVGAYRTEMTFKTWPESDDMTLLENVTLRQKRGFLFWPCGGDETQFSRVTEGWRLEDIFLCKVTSEWSPNWSRGIYTTGLDLKVKLSEVI